MDDLARAAGLSRQALYLHFTSKEDLFRAAILKIIDDDREAYRAALAGEGLGLFDRLLAAFLAFHGKTISAVDSQYVGELLEAAANLVGDAPAEHDRKFLADLAKLLAESNHPRGSASKVTPRELAARCGYQAIATRRSGRGTAAVARPDGGRARAAAPAPPRSTSPAATTR